MSQIIKDAYYLIGLYQDRMKEINTEKVTYLLYLVEAYYMAVNDVDKLYNVQFQFDRFRNLC